MIFRKLNAGSGRILPTMALVVLMAAVVGCGSSNTDSDGDNGNDNNAGDDPDENGLAAGDYAFVAASSRDFASGQIERIDLAAPDAATVAYPSTLSDISVEVFGDAVYQLGRFQLDSLTRFTVDDLETPVYQYSVLGEDTGANPYELVHASETDAFLTRYNAGTIWRIDPSADDESAFRTGSLSLERYVDDVGNSYAEGAELIGNDLYVLLQRLENNVVTRQGYLAQFDIETGQEVDTGKGMADNLPGIPLGVTNPTALQTGDDGMLYVAGAGQYWSLPEEGVNRYTGGVVRIDPTTGDTELLLDDGDESDNIGFVTDLLVTSATEAWIVAYQSWQVSSLYKMNLLDNTLSESPVGGFEGVDIRTLAEDRYGRIWVGLGDEEEPGFKVYDPELEEIVGTYQTELQPINIKFMTID